MLWLVVVLLWVEVIRCCWGRRPMLKVGWLPTYLPTVPWINDTDSSHHPNPGQCINGNNASSSRRRFRSLLQWFVVLNQKNDKKNTQTPPPPPPSGNYIYYGNAGGQAVRNTPFIPSSQNIITECMVVVYRCSLSRSPKPLAWMAATSRWFITAVCNSIQRLFGEVSGMFGPDADIIITLLLYDLYLK